MPTPDASAISFRTVASPPRVASRKNRASGDGGQQPIDQPVQAGAVALDRRRQRHVSAGVEDRGAMVAQESVDEDHVTWSRLVQAQFDPLANDADA